jgi:oxaloacetate decarboxylase alpha subunit
LGYDTGVEYARLKEINDYFRPIQEEYVKSGLLDAKVMGTDADALNYQIPGGMLSNLISQLKASNSMDKFQQVLEETPRVRKEMGYPPLVTPTSQIVGAQSAVNVLVGERYKNVSNEVQAYLRGEYGSPPGEVDPELIKKVLGDEKPYTGRYAETLADGFEAAKKEIGDKAKSDEDVLSYIIFPPVYLKYVEERDKPKENWVNYSIEKI